jgi:broad specificity phosphatase PhoE
MKLLIVIALFLSCAPPGTTYYFVRHAEKACEDCATCGLSAAGTARAQALASYLQNKEIDTIFASQCLRTRHTAQPAATQLQKNVTQYQTGQLTAFINNLKKIHGRNVLVVGHSNQIPVMIDSIANRNVFIDENEYDNLYIVKRKGLFSSVGMRELEYGN